ncbi:hypothetical protein B0H15DRAFT_780339, partial [Mycena belliarum]
ALDLFQMGYAGWAGDIAIILSSLPTPIRVTPADLSCLETVKAIMAKVAEVVDADLQFDIDHFQKTHLLRNRLESIDDTFRLVTRRRRHYLMLVPTASHRKALTRLLLGDHSLSVERLRYPSRYRLAIPREACLCRFCRKSVEEEVHALLLCEAHGPLVAMRDAFLTDALGLDSSLEAGLDNLTPHAFLCALVASRRAARAVCVRSDGSV